MGIETKLSMQEMLALRKMPRSEGEKWLAGRTNLTPDEVIAATKLLKPAVEDKYLLSRTWLAVAWILGASYNQLAWDEGVTRQSIADRISRMLKTRPSDIPRINASISTEDMAEFKVKFYTNHEQLIALPPRHIAEWLERETLLDKIKERPSANGDE